MVARISCNPILDVVIFIRNLFHLGNFEKTEEPAESPITTKISALLNDNTSTGKIIRHILKDRTLNRIKCGNKHVKNILNIFDNRSNN